jgi:aarF domain-containing kinase
MFMFFKFSLDKYISSFRNLNTVRAIARDHGDPVDRYVVLARSASKGQFMSDQTGVLQRLFAFREVLFFELMLW